MNDREYDELKDALHERVNLAFVDLYLYAHGSDIPGIADLERKTHEVVSGIKFRVEEE